MREPGDDDDLDDEGPMVPLGEALRVYADAVRLGLVERAPPDRRPHWEQARDWAADECLAAANRIVGRGTFAASWEKAHPSADAHAATVGLRAVWRSLIDKRLALLACNTVEDFDAYWRNR